MISFVLHLGFLTSTKQEIINFTASFLNPCVFFSPFLYIERFLTDYISNLEKVSINTHPITSIYKLQKVA
jgi:hypothetical protein